MYEVSIYYLKTLPKNHIYINLSYNLDIFNCYKNDTFSLKTLVILSYILMNMKNPWLPALSETLSFLGLHGNSHISYQTDKTVYFKFLFLFIILLFHIWIFNNNAKIHHQQILWTFEMLWNESSKSNPKFKTISLNCFALWLVRLSS